MRKIIAALVTSVDGFIEGPDEEIDWVETWEDPFDLISRTTACILGGRMYPGYERYWGAILDDPAGVLPFTGKIATPGEVEYARFAARTPHLVLSTTLRQVAWKNTRIVRSVDELRSLKQQPGGDMHAVGGATLVSSLINQGLVDELRMVVQPILLGRGKALFKDVTGRHALRLVEARTMQSGHVRLTYEIPG